jgi:circadian clock protein KaiC
MDDTLEYNIDCKYTGVVERIKTGIPGFDDIISGGIPINSITLVSGPPGAGKTILCLQYLYQGLSEGQKCLFFTLDKKIGKLINQALEIGIDFQPAMAKGQIKFLFLDIDKKSVFETMIREILTGKYDRIVLDSLTQLSEIPLHIGKTENTNGISIISTDEFASGEKLPLRRLHLRHILNALESVDSTSLVTSEANYDSTLCSRDGLTEFLVDGVFHFSFDPTMDRRKISVKKMRSTKHTLKPQDIEIGTGGIKIV